MKLCNYPVEMSNHVIAGQLIIARDTVVMVTSQLLVCLIYLNYI